MQEQSVENLPFGVPEIATLRPSHWCILESDALVPKSLSALLHQSKVPWTFKWKSKWKSVFPYTNRTISYSFKQGLEMFHYKLCLLPSYLRHHMTSFTCPFLLSRTPPSWGEVPCSHPVTHLIQLCLPSSSLTITWPFLPLLAISTSTLALIYSSLTALHTCAVTYTSLFCIFVWSICSVSYLEGN